MSKEYIEREAAIELLRYYADEACSAIVADMEAVPAADVASVVHAYWIAAYEIMLWRHGIPKRRKCNRCSNCKTVSAVMHKACPNCRAIMDADTQERDGGKPSRAWNGME